MNGHEDERVQALFRQPPEGFIAARDDLAARLREEGEADRAKDVKALRKPSVSAWALNQLVASDPEGVSALLDAGAELHAAQQATLSSARNAGRMRTASEARREAVTRLTRVASEVLSSSGRTSAGHLDDVAAGLEAASVDPDAGARLRSGTFERPPAPPVGLGEVTGLTLVSTAHVVDPTTSTLDSDVARLRRDRDAAVRTLAKDQGSSELLARERAELRSRLETVEGKLAEVESRLGADEAKVQATERALKRAEARSARARRS